MATQKHCVLYGLSTCIHCKHTIQFLNERGVDFEIHFVDKAEGSERDGLIQTVMKYNPSISFPTVVIDNGKEVVVGFNPEALTEALDL